MSVLRRGNSYGCRSWWFGSLEKVVKMGKCSFVQKGGFGTASSKLWNTWKKKKKPMYSNPEDLLSTKLGGVRADFVMS